MVICGLKEMYMAVYSLLKSVFFFLNYVVIEKFGNIDKIISSLGMQWTTDPRMENKKYLGPHQNTIN